MPLTRRGFQGFVNRDPPPGVAGDYWGANPRTSVPSPPGGYVAAAPPLGGSGPANAGLFVGRFAWGNYATKQATRYFQPNALLGFIHREQQSILVDFLEFAEMGIQTGFMATLMGKGEFWANFVGAASVGQKVYANAQDGTASAAATGQGTQSIGFTAAIAVTTGVMTVSGAGTGNIAVGMVVTGPTVPPGIFVTSLGTGTGGTGTYNTNWIGQPAVASQVMNAFGLIETPFTVASDLPADAVVTGAIAVSTGVLTVSAVTSGVVDTDQYIDGTGVPNNAFIRQKAPGGGTGTGGTGTYQTNLIGNAAVASTTLTLRSGRVAKISNWL